MRRLRPPTGHVRDDQGDQDEEENPYGVAPAAGRSQAEVSLQADPPRFDEADLEETEAATSQEPPPRFSMLDLLVIVSFAGVGLAAAQWLLAGWYIGGLGIVAFVALVVVGIFKPKNHAVQLMLWAGVTAYFFAALGITVARVTGPLDERYRRGPANLSPMPTGERRRKPASAEPAQ